MLLDEPEAGSDVGALYESAVQTRTDLCHHRQQDLHLFRRARPGREHHPSCSGAHLKARRPGTAGISLFWCPKSGVNDDGRLGEPNDIVSPGRGEDGDPRQRHLLHGAWQQGAAAGECCWARKQGHARHVPDDERRLLVGTQGLACASPAYMYA